MCAFSAPCPSFVRLKGALAKAKLSYRFWKPRRYWLTLRNNFIVISISWLQSLFR